MSSVSRTSTHAENEVQDGNSQPRQPNPLIRQPVGAHRPERYQKSVTTQLTDDATAAVAAAPSDAVEAAHARVSAHPTGNALSTDNVHWLALRSISMNSTASARGPATTCQARGSAARDFAEECCCIGGHRHSG